MRGGPDNSSKRLKREELGVVWGEETTGVAERQEDFLFGQLTGVETKLKQSTIKPITGVEWFCRQVLKEVTGKVVDICLEMEGVASWEEWEPEKSTMAWSSKEERKLWAILDELDKMEHKAEKIKLKKEKAKVARARAKMGAGRGQPSILESLMSKSSNSKPAKM